MLKLKLIPGPSPWYQMDLSVIRKAFKAIEGVDIDNTIAMMLWQRYSDAQGLAWVTVIHEPHSPSYRLSDAEIVAALANYYTVEDDDE